MQKAYIYGTGAYYQTYKEQLCTEYEIIGFLDSNKSGEMDSKKISTFSADIFKQDFDVIVVMVESERTCFQITDNIIKSGGTEWIKSGKKVVWGIEKYGIRADCFEKLEVLADGSLKMRIKGIDICVNNLDEFCNSVDTLYNQCYAYNINNCKKDVVIDIGMNIGDATLFFLKNDRVEKVYAYEPFLETFCSAKKNLEAYLETERLEIKQCGLSNGDFKKTFHFQRSMSCGQSTDEYATEKAVETYRDWGLVEEEGREEAVTLRDAAAELREICNQHREHNLILKMDCEGEEYQILEALAAAKLLEKFDFVMLEWHYKGSETLLAYLRNSGFSYWQYDKSEKMGLIYAWNMNKQ